MKATFLKAKSIPRSASVFLFGPDAAVPYRRATNHPQAARLAPAKWPSRSAEMSKRLALAGRVFGIRERLILPDCPLILRSKMATLLRLLGADSPCVRPSVGIQAQRACVMQPRSAEHSEALLGTPNTPDPHPITNAIGVPSKRSTLWPYILFATPLTGPRWGPPSESANVHHSPGEAAARPLLGCMTGPRRGPCSTSPNDVVFLTSHCPMLTQPSSIPEKRRGCSSQTSRL